MSFLKDTKAKMTPAKPILNKMNLVSILGKVKTSPKLHAPSVTSSVFLGTLSRRRDGATKTENKKWYPGGSTISQVNSHLRLLISTVDISELNNAKEYENYATSETQGSDSGTELEYHANMPLVGQNWYILSDSGTFA